MTHRSFILTIYLVLAITTLVAAALPAADRVAFVTSVDGPGELGTWEQANQNTGLAAGDAVCQRRASGVGLPDPMSFIAWLSDSSDDAYCRAHGLSGQVAANCGQETLPDFAGPWVRVDGTPFAPKLSQALGENGTIYWPVTLDENGDTIHALVFTATGADGVFLGSVSAGCSDWTTSGNESVVVGDATAGTVGWTAGDTSSCSFANHLLCLQTGAGDPLPPFWHQGAWMFVTSISGDADLGAWPEAGSATGLAAADAICQARASQQGFPAPSSYIAWLSDGGTDAVDRLILDGPWTRIDGIPIADTLGDLVDGRLHAAPNLDDTGTYLGENSRSWTGSTSDGLGTGYHCDGWSNDALAATGTSGAAFRTNTWWSSYGPPNVCAGEFRLVCFSNTVAAMFVDGFESATTDAWSTVAP